MQQIRREVVRKGDRGLMASGLSIFNGKDLDVEEGDVCFGYRTYIREDLTLGLELPVGEVLSVGENSVSIMSGHGIRTIKREAAEELATRERFVVKGVHREDKISDYEFIFYLNNLQRHYDKFRTNKTMEEVIESIKSNLVDRVRELDNKLFIREPGMMLYTNNDITRDNLDKGRRYRKLVFVRMIGIILTKLFFPYKTNVDVSNSWGYINHTSLYHAKEELLGYLYYDKKTASLIMQLINDTVRWIWS
jgi:hypothetical protein